MVACEALAKYRPHALSDAMLMAQHHIPTENQRLVAFDFWGENGADGIGSDAAYDEYEHWHGISISPDGKTIYMGGTWQQSRFFGLSSPHCCAILRAVLKHKRFSCYPKPHS